MCDLIDRIDAALPGIVPGRIVDFDIRTLFIELKYHGVFRAQDVVEFLESKKKELVGAGPSGTGGLGN